MQLRVHPGHRAVAAHVAVANQIACGGTERDEGRVRRGRSYVVEEQAKRGLLPRVDYHPGDGPTYRSRSSVGCQPLDG